MKPSKRKRLERAGWRLVSTEEFLELSEAEQALVEIKLALTEEIRHKSWARTRPHIWQARQNVLVVPVDEPVDDRKGPFR
jgi:hypothetical protein